MLSSFPSMIRTTTTTFLILLIHVFILQNTSSGVVNAQLYQNCQIDTSTGVTIQSCLVNRPSPLTYTATDGTTTTLGSLSVLAVACDTAVPGTVDTCTCFILVDPGDTIEEADVCTSCTVTTITDAVFENYFDCSNRLTGTCVGLDASGTCISNVDGVPVTAPVTVPAPTVPVPVAVPVAVPVVDPVPTTPAPVADPVDVPTPPPVADVPTAPVDPAVPTTDECYGKGKGKGKGDSEKVKSMKDSSKKKKGKKCKKSPKEPKVPKAGKGKGEGEGKGKGDGTGERR